MKTQPATAHPLPPHLTMDEYVEWLCENWRHMDPASIARQKAIEERVLTPFRIPDDARPPAESAKRASRARGAATPCAGRQERGGLTADRTD